MTVCGEKVTGVCVAGKCPYFKRCHPVVWDKYGKIKPQTNEEYIHSLNTEQLAEWIGNIAKNAYQCGQDGKTNKCVNRNHCTGYCDYGWEMWLKQPHTFK